ncbi:hypothetical protein Pint_19173 [Pistacia integerrima]|uniref:Uncharacterized protein n=1 Tax=Pistacia integerrima TaxID=434235 RepID=A0ACC0YY04_9ROSI|nr:hypothetical protein Pint_19173 [Pistacia integerrima]
MPTGLDGVYLSLEHPYLNRPWYKLHLCGTSEWMKLLFLSNAAPDKHGEAVEQYLVSWFSVVGQEVCLRIPFEMLNDSNRALLIKLTLLELSPERKRSNTTGTG